MVVVATKTCNDVANVFAMMTISIELKNENIVKGLVLEN